MLEKVSTYLKYGHQYCGIEHAGGTEFCSISAVVLKKNRNDISISDSFKVDSIEELSKKLTKNQHAFLIVNDSNVITKPVESNSSDPMTIVNKAFPNLNISDFYYEVLLQEGTDYVALCRKQIIDDVIAEYLKHDISIYGFSLGVLKLSDIIAFLPAGYIQLNDKAIEHDQEQLTSINKPIDIKTDDYSVNGLSVRSTELLAFSGGMDLLLAKENVKTNFDLESKNLKDEFLQKRFFKVFSVSALVFLLAALLINFFVFNHYFNKVSSLEQTSQINQVNKQKMVKLNDDVVKKQNMVEDMLASSSSKSSFYIDRIVNLLPDGIALTEMNYQPLQKRIKSAQPIFLDRDVVLISGNSNNSNAFSSWLANLEAVSWINRVDIIEYGDKTNTNSEFSIKLTLHDE